jgi:outer membrane protein assembly factor BamE (lipoprotein component of BamABCDE complex)
MRSLSFISLLLALAVLPGCNTFERRAQKKADVFATLSPETKARLQSKTIHVGDTSDMVYIALGSPDEKRVSASPTGETTIWTYNRYWQEYRGEAYGGFHRHVVRNPKTGATSVYFEPISRPVYAHREEPVMRVLFTGGKVTTIEAVRR